MHEYDLCPYKLSQETGERENAQDNWFNLKIPVRPALSIHSQFKTVNSLFKTPIQKGCKNLH